MMEAAMATDGDVNTAKVTALNAAAELFRTLNALATIALVMAQTEAAKQKARS